MRACLKNDNYFYAVKNDQEKKKKQLEQKERQKKLKFKNYRSYQSKETRPKQYKQKSEQLSQAKLEKQDLQKDLNQQLKPQSNTNFKFKINSNKKDSFEEDLISFLSQSKMNKQNSLIRQNSNLNDSLQSKIVQNCEDKEKQITQKSTKNIFSRAFFPKSTIKNIHSQNLQQKKNMEQQRKKQQRVMKKQLRIFDIEKKKQKQTISENKNIQSESNSQIQIKQKKQKQKNKKIKKVANYQKLDLKRKYKDQFLGGLRRNQRKYAPNGRFKQKFKVQSQISIEEGEIYNSFVSSLSKALHVNLSLDDQSQQEDQKIVYQIPQNVNKQSLTKFIQDLFGFQSFREGQYEVIQNIVNKKSTIFISQTASGKSLTYIVSSIIMGEKEGISIVISPLIALMLDQLQHLPMDLPAACISSLLNYEQRNKIVTLVKQKKIKLLFMTPETLQSDILFHLKQFPAANFVCIDEAHCLSQLSHNFRTSYLALTQIVKNQIQYINNQPNILCLTATANIQTIHSLQSKLKIQNVVKSSCTINKNLYITISRQKDTQSKSKALVTYLTQKQIKKCKGVLVYCRTKWIIDKVYNYLTNSGINSRIFHGTLTNKQKTEIISSFKDQKIKIILTTTALGMGLDFQHLDCIVHFNMPKSLESYIQQIGRAGRRSLRAYCHLFLDTNDYLIERNYIIADQVQNLSLKIVITEMKKHMIFRVKSQNKKIQNKKKQNMQSVIKRIAFQIQKMQDEMKQKELQQDQEDYQNISQIQQNQNQQIQFKLYYIKVKELAQKTYLRQQTLLTLLIKIQSLINSKLKQKQRQEDFKVLPLSHQVVKLSFFKSNENQLKQASQFYNLLIQKHCKKVGSCYHIHIIEKCNELGLTPIQLMQKIYKISCQYVIKVQLINQIYVWQVAKNVDLKQLFCQIEKNDFQIKLMNQVNSIQITSISKLNVFYSLAFNFARISIDNIVQNKLLISRQNPLPEENIMKMFDEYFNTELNTFYQKITDGDRQAYIPTTLISNQDLTNIFDSIKAFLKHQFSNISDSQNNRRACKQKILNQFSDGKIICRVLMGVNQSKTSWKIYGEHIYWKKFIEKNYHQLLFTVRDLIKNNKDQLMNI